MKRKASDAFSKNDTEGIIKRRYNNVFKSFKSNSPAINVTTNTTTTQEVEVTNENVEYYASMNGILMNLSQSYTSLFQQIDIEFNKHSEWLRNHPRPQSLSQAKKTQQQLQTTATNSSPLNNNKPINKNVVINPAHANNVHLNATPTTTRKILALQQEIIQTVPQKRTQTRSPLKPSNPPAVNLQNNKQPLSPLNNNSKVTTYKISANSLRSLKQAGRTPPPKQVLGVRQQQQPHSNSTATKQPMITVKVDHLVSQNHERKPQNNVVTTAAPIAAITTVTVTKTIQREEKGKEKEQLETTRSPIKDRLIEELMLPHAMKSPVVDYPERRSSREGEIVEVVKTQQVSASRPQNSVEALARTQNPVEKEELKNRMKVGVNNVKKQIDKAREKMMEQQQQKKVGNGKNTLRSRVKNMLEKRADVQRDEEDQRNQRIKAQNLEQRKEARRQQAKQRAAYHDEIQRLFFENNQGDQEDFEFDEQTCEEDYLDISNIMAEDEDEVSIEEIEIELNNNHNKENIKENENIQMNTAANTNNHLNDLNADMNLNQNVTPPPTRKTQSRWRGEGEGTLRKRQKIEHKEHGQMLYGLDLELSEKHNGTLERRDEIQKVMKWLTTIVKSEKDLVFPDDLKSGKHLCMLMNKIRPGIIPRVNARPIPLMERENIQQYLVSCEKLGVEKHNLFVVSDLYEEKYLSAVVDNLYAVARASKNFKSFQGPSFLICKFPFFF